VNRTVENIGARRLNTIIEKLVDKISFSASEHSGETITITAEDVERDVGAMSKEKDFSMYVL